MRNLIIVFGDQLDHNAEVFAGFDAANDAVLMNEAPDELTYVWSHKLRIAAFLSAMRHFRDQLTNRGWTVLYHELSKSTDNNASNDTDNDSDNNAGNDFSTLIGQAITKHQPAAIRVTQPGDYRVQQMLLSVGQEYNIPVEIVDDNHFYYSPESFRSWAAGKQEYLLENFYRHMRKTHDVLMEGQRPVGDKWNLDKDNRKAFDQSGPQNIPPPLGFPADHITSEVIELVETRYADHPGLLEHFDLAVTREQALALLDDFITTKLTKFGDHQDAMWTNQPFLFHSRLSFALNIKLLSPHECVESAELAYRDGKAPLNAVEGFVRQVLGWREYVRGIYWLEMPNYAEHNALQAKAELPKFYWDGQTEMACIQDAMQGVIKHGYAHHIHRLMVLGLFSQLLGVHPYQFHEWHMAMYVDAIDWVSLPNTLGMSQFGDGGIVGTKPYCASGNYINKMSNYCSGCQYQPNQASGANACPFTTLYWDFLARHERLLGDNPRMGFQYKNLQRKRDKGELGAIRTAAQALREKLSG